MLVSLIAGDIMVGILEISKNFFVARGLKRIAASVYSRWLALSFGCSAFKDFQFFCLKASIETGHVKTLEVAK